MVVSVLCPVCVIMTFPDHTHLLFSAGYTHGISVNNKLIYLYHQCVSKWSMVGMQKLIFYKDVSRRFSGTSDFKITHFK